MSTFKSRYTDFFRLDYLAIFVQRVVSDLDEILEVVEAFEVDPRVDPFVVAVVGTVAGAVSVVAVGTVAEAVSVVAVVGTGAVSVVVAEEIAVVWFVAAV